MWGNMEFSAAWTAEQETGGRCALAARGKGLETGERKEKFGRKK